MGWFEDWQLKVITAGGVSQAISILGADPQEAETLALIRGRAQGREGSIELAWGYINGIGIGLQQSPGRPRELHGSLLEMLGREESGKDLARSLKVDTLNLIEAASGVARASASAIEKVSAHSFSQAASEGILLGFYACRRGGGG